MVRDLQPTAALFRRTDGLFDGFQDLARLAAHVRRVDAAVPGRDLAEFHEFRRIRVASGRIDEAGRQPDAPVLEFPREQRLHAFEFRFRRLPVVEAHDRDADRPLRREKGQVRRMSVPVDDVHDLARVRPGEVRHRFFRDERLEVVPEQAEPFRIDRGEREAAVAPDLRRHALDDLSVRVVDRRAVAVRVTVRVDEPRGDGPASRVNTRFRVGRVRLADSGDESVDDRYVGVEPRPAASVIHPRVFDDEIVPLRHVSIRSFPFRNQALPRPNHVSMMPRGVFGVTQLTPTVSASETTSAVTIACIPNVIGRYFPAPRM